MWWKDDGRNVVLLEVICVGALQLGSVAVTAALVGGLVDGARQGIPDHSPYIRTMMDSTKSLFPARAMAGKYWAAVVSLIEHNGTGSAIQGRHIGNIRLNKHHPAPCRC